MSSMASIGNLLHIPEAQKAGRRLNCQVWLIHVSQVDDLADFPSPNINRELGTIPLKKGEYMHRFEAIADTIKDESRGERGEITSEVINSLEIVMGGDARKLFDFMELHTGGGFIVIYQEADQVRRFVAGTKLRPMILRSSIRKMDNEMTGFTFRFENVAISLPKVYVGSIVDQDPVVVPVDSISLALTRWRDQYLVPENTAIRTMISVTGIDEDMHGKHIEILGGSFSYPTVIKSNDEFILVDKADWSTSDGNSIIFRIHDSNTLVEVFRKGYHKPVTEGILTESGVSLLNEDGTPIQDETNTEVIDAVKNENDLPLLNENGNQIENE